MFSSDVPPEATSASAAANIDLGTELARLSELNLEALRARWRIVFGRIAPDHLPRRLLYRILAYRLQAERLGDLDQNSCDVLERLGEVTRSDAHKVSEQLKQVDAKLRHGTVLTREWNDGVHRVTVLPEGFSWEGRTYRSLSAVASAIAGSRWNGHRFFGLRDKTRPRGRP
jgi:hypothetical protein